jgi:hypothetical protein
LRPGDSSARGGTVKYAVLRDHAASTSTALLGAIAARDWLITGELVRVKIDNPSTRTLRSDGGERRGGWDAEDGGPTTSSPEEAGVRRARRAGLWVPRQCASRGGALLFILCDATKTAELPSKIILSTSAHRPPACPLPSNNLFATPRPLPHAPTKQ